MMIYVHFAQNTIKFLWCDAIVLKVGQVSVVTKQLLCCTFQQFERLSPTDYLALGVQICSSYPLFSCEKVRCTQSSSNVGGREISTSNACKAASKRYDTDQAAPQRCCHKTTLCFTLHETRQALLCKVMTLWSMYTNE